jgi:hypothetical protein
MDEAAFVLAIHDPSTHIVNHMGTDKSLPTTRWWHHATWFAFTAGWWYYLGYAAALPFVALWYVMRHVDALQRSVVSNTNLLKDFDEKLVALHWRVIETEEELAGVQRLMKDEPEFIVDTVAEEVTKQLEPRLPWIHPKGEGQEC